MSLFTISSLLVFFTSIGFASFVYFNDPKSKANKSWLLANVAIGLWGLGLFGVTYSTDPSASLGWQYLLDISAIFIPLTFLYFVFDILGLKRMWARYIVLLLTIGLALFSLTRYFKTGMTTRFGFNWIEPGPYYYIFPAFFLLVTAYCLGLVYKVIISRDASTVLKSQIKYIFIGGVISFAGGATNFFPQFFNIYPFGNYLVILYVAFISYSVLKHQLFNAKSIAAELFGGALTVVSLFGLLTAVQFEDIILKIIQLILVIIFSILLVRTVKNEIEQREKIEKLAWDLEQSKNELEVANVKLQELDRKKTEFVSIASHQLRSPLTAIKGYTSMLLEGSFGKLEDKSRDAVDRISQSCQKLMSIIEDFLNVTRIELGTMKYTMSEFDLAELAQNVTVEQKPTVMKRGLNITCSADSGNHKIYADVGKVNQVINNVIDNAVKYTKEGSIAVNVVTLQTGGKNKVRLTVTDTGVGIDPATMPKLFEKFIRADDAGKTNISGTGLGLYVAKQIVEGLGGRIWAESEGKGKGSTFVVEFPIAIPGQQNQPTSTPIPTA